MKKVSDKPVGYLCQVCGWRYFGECTSNVCGGNVARYERFKLELGTRLVYLRAAPPVGDELTSLLGVKLLMEAHRRKCATKDRTRTHWIDAGYCIDAPNEMPAGGCFGMTFEDLVDDSDVVPCQLTVWREERF